MVPEPGAVLETDAEWAAQDMDVGQDAEWADADKDKNWASTQV